MNSAADMQYLRWHWDDIYEFADRDGGCSAVAKFGHRDVLEADSPAELLVLVRRHYPRNRSADQCST